MGMLDIVPVPSDETKLIEFDDSNDSPPVSEISNPVGGVISIGPVRKVPVTVYDCMFDAVFKH